MKILAADIGGTYSRFGLFLWENRKLSLAVEKVFPSKGSDFGGLLASLVEDWRSFGAADAHMVAFAAAGPLRGTRIDMTNAGFSIDGSAVRKRFPDARCILMNDFEAQAWACLSPAMSSAACVLPRAGVRAGFSAGAEGRPVAVLGAGTGLGAAWLLAGVPGFAGVSRPFVLPSEAGHSMFPFDDNEEENVIRHELAALHGQAPTAEQVLSGPGLAALHSILTGERRPPEEFTGEAGFRESPTCRIYAKFLGRFCRNTALAMLPGAIVVAGGVAGKTPCLVHHRAFAEEFFNVPAVRKSLLESIPVWLSAHPQAGLWGAAWAALTAF